MVEENKVININYIYSLNFRIAKQILGSSNKIIEYVLDKEKNSIYNTLIISPPGYGKTTILRDLIRQISSGIKDIKFNFEGTDQITLSGRELPYYVDILLILIDNSIKHSHLSLEELNVEMYIETIENQTQILVKNTISHTGIVFCGYLIYI